LKRNTDIIEAYNSTDLWMCLSCSHCCFWLYEAVFWTFSDLQICGFSDEREESFWWAVSVCLTLCTTNADYKFNWY